MPTPSKAPEDRLGHHAPPTDLETMPGPGVEVAIPRPPIGLSAGLRRSWDGLWRSPVAKLFDPVSDLPVVSRLYYLYKLSDRIARQIDKADPERLVTLMEDEDPTEETRRLIAEIAAAVASWNATVATQVRVATEVRQLETTLGISPKARLALGVALGQVDRSAIDGLMDE